MNDYEAIKVNVCIFYFTGTGNTKKIVDLYVKNFLSSDCTVTAKAIESCIDEEGKINLNEYDKIGIAYPIHAFNAPSIVLDFARRFPSLPHKKELFIVKTSGEPLALNHISSLKLASVLKRKNLILTNEYHYCMPYNIIFRHAESTAYKMYTYAEKVIPYDCYEIVKGKHVKLPTVFCGRFLAWIFRIEHWGGRFNGKRYKVGDNCINCLKCVRSCPVKNIEFDGSKFKFGNQCLMCMRCSFGCPKNAIKIGLFNKWKVNGAYSFTESDDEERHKKYCKKSYDRYFARINGKIEKYNGSFDENQR